ncbi:FeoB-associated Cys-rich membrane protein [Bacillus sp. FJAT-27245]|nr:FeoB-associated Cys-rich membrane protein [Bacillus sp. FJAT-27245]
MAYLFIAIVVLVVGTVIFKMIRNRKLPSNNYTPFDDLTTGKVDKE